eukprot:524605_1
MTEIWKCKLQSDLCNYLRGVALENRYNNGYKKLSTFSEYAAFRKNSSGVKSTLRWIELHNPSYYCNKSTTFDIKFEETAALIVGIDNDLFSKPNDNTCTTRSILDVMDRDKTVQLRNNMMKRLVDSTSSHVYYKQITSFIEGIARWQLSAKKRYGTNSMDISNNYNDAIDNASFYYPNPMNTNWKEYVENNQLIFNELTEKSYDFANSHQLFVHNDVSKMYKHLNLGNFSLSYPFIDPYNIQNKELLQIVCDFVGWLTVLDDTILEFTDDAYPFDFFYECFQELQPLFAPISSSLSNSTSLTCLN